jgi:LuxR family transcriptional activator of bioluminescence operon
MFNVLEAFENQLVQARTLIECNQALVEYLKKQGLKTFSFTYYAYHPHSANKLKYDTCSDNFRLWHQHYLEQQYNDIDSTMDLVYSAHLPIYWNLKQQLALAKNEKERQMRIDSIAFGVECGLSIPVHGPQNNFAILLIVQMQNEKNELANPQRHYEFFMAAHLYYHHIQTHLLDEVNPSPAFNLSQREIQCLLLVAKQCSVKEMAQQLEVTERTVNFHIQKLNKKLGTKNKYQSLQKATELKLLTL